jgi:Leucine-rich repeat (LRR) protein
MFLIFLILIRFSFGNQCPLSNYCTCSSDITVIECTNRRLTNDLLLKLNSQLPKSTIVLNLSSNSLTSIKSLSNLNSLQILDLSFNKIRYLPSNIASKFPQLTSLNLQNNSLKSIPKSFKKLPNLNLNLSNNQFHCTCQLKAFKNTTVLKNLICQNNKPFDENDFCPGNKSSLNANRSVLLNNSSTGFCQSIQMNTSKGYFYWPRTLINTKIEIKCPFGSAAWLRNSNEYARAWYTCSSDRKWIHFDVSQCAFQTNISRIFDQLSLNDTTLLLDLVKYLTKINQDDIKLNDIILLIDLIEDQQEKYQNQDRIMLIYHLTDFILQIKQDFRHSEQYRIAITRLTE